MRMFDPNYKRIELANWIVCQLPHDVEEARAVLTLASDLCPTLFNSKEAQADEEPAER